jgi:hypothetical protein
MVRFVGANDCTGETAIVRSTFARTDTAYETNNAEAKM